MRPRVAPNTLIAKMEAHAVYPDGVEERYTAAEIAELLTIIRAFDQVPAGHCSQEGLTAAGRAYGNALPLARRR